MKLLLLFLTVGCLALRATEENKNKPMDRRHHGHHKGPHHHKDGHHHGGMHYRKSGGKYQRIVEEELDPQRKAMNQQMRDVQDVLKKNMQILAAQRRQIKNLTSLDAKKKSKEAISAACEEIKEEVNKFQTQIANTVDSIELL
jgi:hypothetical protein